MNANRTNYIRLVVKYILPWLLRFLLYVDVKYSFGFIMCFYKKYVSILPNIWYFNPGWYNAQKEGLKCLTEEYDGDHDRNCEYGLHIKSVP